jgi:hypothetical protein
MTKTEILEELVYEQKKHSICKHCPIRWNGGRSHPRAGKVKHLKPEDLETDVVRHAPRLHNGNIPAFTECPFKQICELKNTCHHLGRNHKVDFSCAWARRFELSRKENSNDY